MTTTLKLSLLSFLALAGTAGAAHAGHGRGRSGHIDLARIDAVRDGRNVAIDLEIEPGSWRWVQDRAVDPMLHVRLGSRGVERAYRIADATSHVVVVADRGGEADADAATVWMTGDGRRTQVTYMKLGGASLYTLELRLRDAQDRDRDDDLPPPPPPPPPPRIDYSKQPDVIRACNVMNDTLRCLGATMKARFNPAPVMKACGQMMSSYDLTAQCIDIAVTADADPTERLQTCVRLASTFDGTMRCFKASVRAVYDPKAAIKACVLGTSTLDNMYGCIDLVTAAPSDPSETVKACVQAARTTDQILPCVARALGR